MEKQPIGKEELNELIKNIIKTVINSATYFNCPFCADEYLFEFTLKHHLNKNHIKDLHNIIRSKTSPDLSIKFCDSNICPFCGCMFYYISAIPKHILNSHSRECLAKWQAIEKNSKHIQDKKDSEPSITYVPCTPGLTKLFEDFSMSSDMSLSPKKFKKPSPLLKSVLKSNARSALKESNSGSWQRNEAKIPKRISSVRRELKFEGENIPVVEKSEKKTIKLKRFFSFRGLRPRLSLRKFRISKKYNCKIVTSTPNNFLDDFDDAARYNQWNRIHID